MRVLFVIGLSLAMFGGCGIPDEHFEGIDEASTAVRLLSPAMVPVGTRHPTLRWAFDGDLSSPSVILCQDAGCRQVTVPGVQLASDGLSAVITSDLPLGATHWQVSALPPQGTTRVQSRIWEMWSTVSSQTNQVAYATAPPVLDINGDGRADLVAGVPGSGEALVLLGQTGGSVGELDLTMPSGAAGGFGGAVASIGDINGDGYADFAVAASTEAGSGVVHIYYGTSNPDANAWLSSSALHIDLGPPATAGATGGFGTSVTGAGDVNGDGYADFLIGNGHQTFLFLGSATPSAMAWLDAASKLRLDLGDGGGAIAGVGDVNGDGFADFAITGNGGARIYLGSAMPSASSWSTGIQRVDLTNPGSMSVFGFSVASAGDVNSDGYNDFVVGSTTSTGASPPGEAHLYLGSATPSAATWNAATTATRIDLVSPDGTAAGFGYSVASAGDIDRDGHDDFVIGAARAAGNGAAHLYLGSATPSATAWNGATPTARIDLPNPSGLPGFGATATSVGDIDGDGFSDVAIGSLNGAAGGLHIYLGVGAPTAASWANTTPHRIDINRADIASIARSVGSPPAAAPVGGPASIR